MLLRKLGKENRDSLLRKDLLAFLSRPVIRQNIRFSLYKCVGWSNGIWFPWSTITLFNLYSTACLKRACFLLKINYLIEEGIACPMTSKRRRRNLLDLLAPIAWPQPWTTCTEAFPSRRADRPSLVKSLLPLKHPFRQRRTEQAHLLLWLGVDWEKKSSS